jgi:hypothetical protein
MTVLGQWTKGAARFSGQQHIGVRRLHRGATLRLVAYIPIVLSWLLVLLLRDLRALFITQLSMKTLQFLFITSAKAVLWEN